MTFIDGIAASENIDSSGERISIAGMDISSLATEGVFTYEHEAAKNAAGENITIKMPHQTVGKILKAKKIFSEKDCEDDRELHFWKKCQTPYIYIMGELFDDYTDAARDLAGKFRYDSDRKDQNQRSVMNFSIEGSYIARNGIEVTRSVARKCTITVFPCNKAAIAEMVPSPTAKKSNDIDSLFKTETIEIELFKAEIPFAVAQTPAINMKKHADILGIEPMKKNVLPFKKPLTTSPATAIKPAASGPAGTAPKAPGATTSVGTPLGTTKAGRSVFSHGKIHEYHGFTSADHQQAANMHHAAAQDTKDPSMGAHHLDKMKLHLQAARTAEQREARFSRGKTQHLTNTGILKGMEAGSGMAAPSELSQEAALAKEDLKGKMTKSEWLARAEQEYDQWDKREEYRKFMKIRMPHLAQGEIDAIGKTIALKKSLENEENMSKLIKR